MLLASACVSNDECVARYFPEVNGYVSPPARVSPNQRDNYANRFEMYLR